MTGEGLTTSTFSSGTFLAAVAAAISTVGVADVQNLVVRPTVATGLGTGAVLSLDIDFDVVTFEDAVGGVWQGALLLHFTGPA